MSLFIVENFFIPEVADKIRGPLNKPLVGLTIFSSIGIGLGFALGNYVYLVKSIEEITGMGSWACSGLVWIVLLFLLKLIIEPEKIKPLAFLLSFFILTSACLLLFHNFWSFFSGKVRLSEKKYWDTQPSGLLIGVTLFSFESISSIINGTFYFI